MEVQTNKKKKKNLPLHTTSKHSTEKKDIMATKRSEPKMDSETLREWRRQENRLETLFMNAMEDYDAAKNLVLEWRNNKNDRVWKHVMKDYGNEFLKIPHLFESDPHERMLRYFNHLFEQHHKYNAPIAGGTLVTIAMLYDHIVGKSKEDAVRADILKAAFKAAAKSDAEISELLSPPMCLVCGIKMSEVKCGSCYNTAFHYCSVECAKKHWTVGVPEKNLPAHQGKCSHEYHSGAVVPI